MFLHVICVCQHIFYNMTLVKVSENYVTFYNMILVKVSENYVK